jgi:hypothetical protein
MGGVGSGKDVPQARDGLLGEPVFRD